MLSFSVLILPLFSLLALAIYFFTVSSIYIHLCPHLQTSELEILVGTALFIMLSFYLAFISLLSTLSFDSL